MSRLRYMGRKKRRHPEVAAATEGSLHFAFNWKKAMSPNRTTSVAFVRSHFAWRFFVSPADKDYGVCGG
jgi:hypothetical protein